MSFKVCHSMGFAYAQGMIAHLKSKGYKIGCYYILAPENPSSGSVTLSHFEKVWQYGSDEKNDPIWEQDGVAAQVAVGNLNDFRVFIPLQKDVDFTKNFTNSHSVKNYGWIFTKITNQDAKGYVKKRY